MFPTAAGGSSRDSNTGRNNVQVVDRVWLQFRVNSHEMHCILAYFPSFVFISMGKRTEHIILVSPSMVHPRLVCLCLAQDKVTFCCSRLQVWVARSRGGTVDSSDPPSGMQDSRCPFLSGARWAGLLTDSAFREGCKEPKKEGNWRLVEHLVGLERCVANCCRIY